MIRGRKKWYTHFSSPPNFEGLVGELSSAADPQEAEVRGGIGALGQPSGHHKSQEAKQ
jgi:hypothetical protein